MGEKVSSESESEGEEEEEEEEESDKGFRPEKEVPLDKVLKKTEILQKKDTTPKESTN